MKIIRYLYNKYPLLFIFAGFVIVSLIFNYNVFWKELFVDRSKTGAVWGEVQVFEWLTDKFYRTIREGKNPFGLVQGMLYPFSIQVGLTDAGNGLFFLLLRPFLSIHQSMSVVVAFSLFFANIGMYLLLRRLRFNRAISFFVGLAYGYMTFLLPRGGHLNYWVIYVFPWFYYCALVLFTSKFTHEKWMASIGTAFFFVLTLWVNFYYFIMLLVSVLSFFLYFLIFNRNLIFKYIVKAWNHILFTSFFIGILLLPWISGLFETIKFEEIPKTSGWGGAIEFSSDLFGFFIPSQYNYVIYNYLTPLYSFIIGNFLKFATGIFENFTYPGLIIIISYFVLIYFLLKKRVAFHSVFAEVKPYLYASLVFFILTLGPFLHVFGKWGLTVDKGIRIVIPLPYAIFHYIPFLNNIRVPGRLIVGFIFFAYIVSAYVIAFFLKNKTVRFKYVFFIMFFLVFFLDQRWINSVSPPSQEYPYAIFSDIKNDKQRVSVLEIPFTVRDGFTYFGDGNAIANIIGEALHEKPVIGGYTGRIADYKKAYYRVNPLFGYLGRFIDADVKNNPSLDKEDLIHWNTLDYDAGKDVVEFLDVKYVITDDRMKYTPAIFSILKNMEYVQTKQDGNFSLWKKTLIGKEFLNIDVGGKNDVAFLGMGWQPSEGNYRWAGKKSFVMFKIKEKRPLTLRFTASSLINNNKATVYINKKKVGIAMLDQNLKEYSFSTDKEIIEGINTVHFIFQKEDSPKNVFSDNEDTRQLSAKFTNIHLEEK